MAVKVFDEKNGRKRYYVVKDGLRLTRKAKGKNYNKIRTFKDKRDAKKAFKCSRREGSDLVLSRTCMSRNPLSTRKEVDYRKWKRRKK